MKPDAQLWRSCPVCGSGDAADVLQKSELRLVSCRACSMVYANPVPVEYASGKFYDDSSSYYLSAAKLEGDFAEVRFERELKLFRARCSAGSVLDVGCSSGGFLYQLTKRFPGAYQVVGTDASGPALEYAASRGLRVTRGDFLAQDFKADTFDAVTFWAVLEHLSSPGLFLEKAAKVLKPGGHCFVLVPNLRSLAMRLLGKRYRYVYPQHLNYFAADTLRKLAHSWFDRVECRSTHFNPLVIWQDWRSGGAEVPNEQRAGLLRRTTAYKQNPLLAPARWAYTLAERALGIAGLADNLAMVFRKR